MEKEEMENDLKKNEVETRGSGKISESITLSDTIREIIIKLGGLEMTIRLNTEG